MAHRTFKALQGGRVKREKAARKGGRETTAIPQEWKEELRRDQERQGQSEFSEALGDVLDIENDPEETLNGQSVINAAFFNEDGTLIFCYSNGQKEQVA